MYNLRQKLKDNCPANGSDFLLSFFFYPDIFVEKVKDTTSKVI